MKDRDIIIIGAGLAGLSLAYYLFKRGIQSWVLEGRSRAGGRIDTMSLRGGTLEMGATWIQPQHTQVIRLAEELGVGLLPQYTGHKVIYDLPGGVEHYLLPPAATTYRIKGGTSILIDALHAQLPPDTVKYNQKVEHLSFANAGQVAVQTAAGCLSASTVISSLPPNLLVNTISTDEGWPLTLSEVADRTHTWMGESIKVGLEVSNSPWLDQEVGMILSNVGPATELHDHGRTSEGHLLKGFMDPSYHTVDQSHRKMEVLKQFERLFSQRTDGSTSYFEKVWSEDPFTNHPYGSFVAPHQNNGASIFRDDFYDGRLVLIGAETSAVNPGYMDGAVARSLEVAEVLSKKMEKEQAAKE